MFFMFLNKFASELICEVHNCVSDGLHIKKLDISEFLLGARSMRVGYSGFPSETKRFIGIWKTLKQKDS